MLPEKLEQLQSGGQSFWSRPMVATYLAISENEGLWVNRNLRRTSFFWRKTICFSLSSSWIWASIAWSLGFENVSLLVRKCTLRHDECFSSQLSIMEGGLDASDWRKLIISFWIEASHLSSFDSLSMIAAFIRALFNSLRSHSHWSIDHQSRVGWWLENFGILILHKPSASHRISSFDNLSTFGWLYSVMVNTLDFESKTPGSSPGTTFKSSFRLRYSFWIFCSVLHSFFISSLFDIRRTDSISL